MTDTILPERLTVPPSSATPSISRLPDVILNEGANRLQVASLLYSTGILIVFFGVNIAKGAVRPELFIEPRSLIAGAAVILGLGFFAIARYANIRLDRLMDLGLIFLVLGTFFLSLANTWDAYPTWEGEIFGVPLLIPWECVWILMFPLLAPNTPGKTALASYSAATTAPLALLLSMAFGATSPDAPFPSLAAYFLVTTYLCAFLAYVVSRSTYKVGAQLKEAQDVGSYRLIELLGAGGMGEVWVAEHSMLARPSAIKLIRPEMLGDARADREMVSRRFEREAQATAALHSSHTISIYDFGITEAGSFFYVMELLEGMNLDELIKVHGPISAARAVYLLEQACHSLAEAHHDGLIHRDIKPANIFASRMGLEYDFVKVLDFGLVKTPKGTDADVVELTVEGMAYGTPGFMAPEIAMGEADIDGRVDIYGIGCVAYWLLTGKRVFKGETPMAEAIHHIQSEPTPPSERTQIEIPESLEKVILSCLAKDPAERPQSALELGRLFSESVPEGAWSQEKAEEWWQLHMLNPGTRGMLDTYEGLDSGEPLQSRR